MAITLQIVGYKKSGKTTVIQELIPRLNALGLQVAVVKHDVHQARMDEPGTDTATFAQSGANQVILNSPLGQFSYQKKPMSLDQQIQAINADIILIEGFKDAHFNKIALLRPADSPSWPKQLDHVVQLATIQDPVNSGAQLNQLDSICDWIINTYIRERQAPKMTDKLTHFNDQQRARMVDVSDKAVTARTATATGQISMQPATLARIHEGSIKKGDVLAVAQVAGIMAAKQTSSLIPMCHLIPLTGVDLHFSDDQQSTITVTATVKTKHVTGVEIEAILAVQTALLTIYDMCKAIDRGMLITNVHLVDKDGGKSGHFVYSDSEDQQ